MSSQTKDVKRRLMSCLKKMGVRKIHHMRIIGLVEADFNTALEIMFAQKLMWQAEASSITPDQWGGHADR